MTRKNWHTERNELSVTLARHLPARFDVSASASFPLVARTRLAHQIRQDMWRALQNVRGFSPVVRVEKHDDVLRVTAGGRVSAPVSARVGETIETLLTDKALRARWITRSGGMA